MTTFDANEAIETCAACIGDPEKPAINGIHLRFNTEGEARLEATDSFQAVRIALPVKEGVFSEAIRAGAKWVPLKGQPLTWESFKQFAVPSPKGIHRFDEIFIGVKRSEHQFKMNPVGHGTGITDFAYFDGERRRPQGVIALSVKQSVPNKIDLFCERGMRIFGDPRVRSMLAWEEKPTLLATLSQPKGFKVSEHGVLGVFSAKYVGHLDHSFALGWSGLYKPLAFESHAGMYEHLVMPIRMPS